MTIVEDIRTMRRKVTHSVNGTDHHLPDKRDTIPQKIEKNTRHTSYRLAWIELFALASTVGIWMVVFQVSRIAAVFSRFGETFGG